MVNLRQDPLSRLAEYILENRKIVFITGAGLSAASGVPVFRGEDPNSIWVRRATSLGTKAALLKDPLNWWNDFWFQLFKHEYTAYTPNAGHEALARLCNLSANILIVNQNIDALQQQTKEQWDTEHQLVEVHGRLGLYHCSTDEGDCNLATETFALAKEIFPPEVVELIEGEGRVGEGGSDSGAATSASASASATTTTTPSAPPPPATAPAPAPAVIIAEAPRCPECQKGWMMPLALLFDEDYQSHAFYQSDKVMGAFEEAEVLVFVGTSFQVNITNLAMNEGPRKRGVPVFNFNLRDTLRTAGGKRYAVYNVLGPAEVKLQELVEKVEMARGEAKRPRLSMDGENGGEEEGLGMDGGGGMDEKETTISDDCGIENPPCWLVEQAAAAQDGKEEKEEEEGSAAANAAPPPPASLPLSLSSYDLWPQPPLTRPLDEHDVKIDFQPCYGRQTHPNAAIEASIDELWITVARQREAQQCSALFNASKFRLFGFQMERGRGGGKEEGDNEEKREALTLQCWVTDYKTFRGTNSHPQVAQLQEDGRRDYDGDAGAYLSQKLGVSGIVHTLDGHIVLLRRSQKGVLEHPGLVDTPGGHPEPANVGLNFPPPAPPLSAATTTTTSNGEEELGRKICHEIFHSAVQEAIDEVNVPLEKLGTPKLLGVVQQIETAGPPSAAFFIPCYATSDQVRAYYQAGPKEGEESSQLLFMDAKEIALLLQNGGRGPPGTNIQLAPAGQGGLALFLQHLGALGLD